MFKIELFHFVKRVISVKLTNKKKMNNLKIEMIIISLDSTFPSLFPSFPSPLSFSQPLLHLPWGSSPFFQVGQTYRFMFFKFPCSMYWYHYGFYECHTEKLPLSGVQCWNSFIVIMFKLVLVKPSTIWSPKYYFDKQPPISLQLLKWEFCNVEPN